MTVAAGISDMIAGFIQELLNQTGGSAELQRAELASRFKCVPSQINYVISTRFSPEHGYVVESRRGGSGYIRITRVRADPKRMVMHTLNSIGDTVDARTASALISNLTAAGILENRDARLLLAATGEQALQPVPTEWRDAARASVFKQLLIHLFI
ncbi:MAG: CtsR family transcriptional regulator [Oscillospiraceae bacterium]|nr:CtsR family transcriptional regulator [Oscillospiraceae bacterium]